jgi:hypothetical protein
VTAALWSRRRILLGWLLVGLAAIVYWLSNRFYNDRPDFFYLAQAFDQGKTWLDIRLGPWDVIPVGDRIYVPFAPFPAIVLMPLAAVFGASTLTTWQSGINATLSAMAVGLCWWLLGRLGVQRLRDRFFLVLLFGFSTVIWWVTTRGGVWHTGQIIATILTFGCLIELWGRRRAALIGLLAGAAFLTRAPLAFALPFYALLLLEREPSDSPPVDDARLGPVERAWPIRDWVLLGLAFGLSVAFFFWYNFVRFGSPLESGYDLATLPSFLQRLRDQGLFSLAHVPMNLDYFLFHLPKRIAEPPFFRPDGLGMSIFLTSPGLLLAFFAPHTRRALWLAGAAVAVLIPTLLYYGGGWIQYGYRYFLDSIPFVIALCALAVAKAGSLSWFWRVVILFGVAINLAGVYWAYHI